MGREIGFIWLLLLCTIGFTECSILEPDKYESCKASTSEQTRLANSTSEHHLHNSSRCIQRLQPSTQGLADVAPCFGLGP